MKNWMTLSLTLKLGHLRKHHYFPPRRKAEGAPIGAVFKNRLLCRLGWLKEGFSEQKHNNYRKESSASFSSPARKGAAAVEE